MAGVRKQAYFSKGFLKSLPGVIILLTSSKRNLGTSFFRIANSEIFSTFSLSNILHLMSSSETS